MSQVLAGLVGGLLALAGAFGVAWFTGRQSDQQRKRELAASFIATVESLTTLAKHMHHRSSWHTADVGLTQLLELQGQVSAIGNQLALLCTNPLADAILDVVQFAHNLVFEASVPSLSDPEWDDFAEKFDERAGALELSLHEILGSR